MMFQFYYLFSQHFTYIDDIGLKPEVTSGDVCYACVQWFSGAEETGQKGLALTGVHRRGSTRKSGLNRLR
jgi:hypothetical protein